MATPTIDRPAPTPDNGKDRKFGRGKIALTIALGAGAIGIWTYSSLNNDINDNVKTIQDRIQENYENEMAERGQDIYNGDPVVIEVQRPEGMNLDNATPDNNQFFNDRYFTDQERVDWAYGVLNQPSTNPEHEGMTLLEAAHKDLQKKYNDPGGYQYVVDLVQPSENMTGDQILALYATITDIQLNSDLPLETRLKLTAAIHDNSNPNASYVLEDVRTGNKEDIGGLDAVNVTSDNRKLETPVFSDHVLSNGYDPAGTPSKVIDAMSTTVVPAPPRYQVTLQFRNGKPVIMSTANFVSADFLENNDLLTVPAN